MKQSTFKDGKFVCELCGKRYIQNSQKKRHIDVVHKGVLQRGEHTFSISTNRFKVRLSVGQYFYRINIPGGDILSASFFVK